MNHYTIISAHASTTDNEIGLRIWDFDGETLSLQKELPTPANCSWWHFDSDKAYAVSEQTKGRLFEFEWNDQEFTLQCRQTWETLGADPCHLTPYRSGIAVAHYSSGSVSWIKDDKILAHHFSGSGPVSDRQNQPHAHMVLASPCGQYLLCSDLGADRIWILDLMDDNFIVIDQVQMPAGSGPRHMAFDSLGHYLYVTGELSDQSYRIQWQQPGRLSKMPLEVLSGADCQPMLNYPSHLLFDRQDLLWVSQRGRNSLALYGDLATKPQLIEEIPIQANFPRHFCISNDGRYIISAGQKNGVLSILCTATNQIKHFEIGATPLWVNTLE